MPGLGLSRRGTLRLLAGLPLLAGAGASVARGAAGVDAAALRRELAGLIDRGGVIVGGPVGVAFRYVQGAGDDARFIPASIIKIATALTALETLGAGYRFPTEVYREGSTLYLRGYGDPFLVSEEWALMAQSLARAGLFGGPPLEDIVLDDSAFAEGMRVPGRSDSANPYDARLGALVANFNTVALRVGADGSVTSAEPQTPLTPTARRVARRLPPGSHRINLSSQQAGGLHYAGELARAIFRRHGARLTGTVRAGRVPKGLRPIWVHHSSRPLSAVVAAMLEYSNNFIANQLVLALALVRSGEPARLQDGMDVIARFLQERLGLGPAGFTLQEGAGLSRQNRISLPAMLGVVNGFAPWRHLLSPFGPEGARVPAKTGTLTGVYTLAGFLPGAAGEPAHPFVIMLNQQRHTRTEVLQALQGAFGGAAGPRTTAGSG